MSSRAPSRGYAARAGAAGAAAGTALLLLAAGCGTAGNQGGARPGGDQASGGTAPPSTSAPPAPPPSTSAPTTGPSSSPSPRVSAPPKTADPPLARDLPHNATAYADELVRAWGRGDRHDTARYAQPAAVRALFGHADPGGDHWRRVSVEGAAGTIYVTYHDDAKGGRLTLAVTNQRAATGRPHAAREAHFTS